MYLDIISLYSESSTPEAKRKVVGVESNVWYPEAPTNKDMRKDFFNARSFNEENQNEDLNEEEGEEKLSMMGDENMDLYSPGLS